MPVRERFKRLWKRSPQPSPTATTPSQTNQNGSPLPEATRLQINEPVGTPTETSNDNAPPPDLWERAEREILADKSKAKTYRAYLELVETEYGLKLQQTDAGADAAARRAQLGDMLETKGDELRMKASRIDFGPWRSGEARDVFVKVSKNVLGMRDIVNGVARASLPATIACAGAFSVLSVSQQLVYGINDLLCLTYTDPL